MKKVNGYKIQPLANLQSADLNYADLNTVDLHHANLFEANLRESDLTNADLHCANLCYANLRGANLAGADLLGTDLRRADLSGANFTEANLAFAKLDECELIRKGVKLKEKMIGYKKCQDDCIVKLEIPRGAIVFSINNSKCRTDRCKVLEITDRRGNKIDRAFSEYKYFSYYVGDEIEIFDFNCEYNEECAEGIHFFRTKKEAEDY